MTDDASPRRDVPRVLVVDDSGVARRQLREAIEGAGLAVCEASEGLEALSRARQQRFDLILTDLHMPTMDGLELIRELRKCPGYEHTPVYVLTSDGCRERLAEGRAVGATAWIVKPPNLTLLVNAVLKVTAKRSE